MGFLLQMVLISDWFIVKTNHNLLNLKTLRLKCPIIMLMWYANGKIITKMWQRKFSKIFNCVNSNVPMFQSNFFTFL